MVVFRRAQAFTLLLLAACSSAPHPTSSPTPPPDAGRRIEAKSGVVSSANALASEAGLEILRAGGNAVDAAVATAFAIGVVEPQMSGVGGGGAALVWMKGEGRPEYLDFYAAQYAPSFRGHTAPNRRPDDLRIVGIPGNVAGLLELHERWGTLPRERVMAPAIRLAEEGFPVGQILAEMIRSDSAKLARFPASWTRYWPNGRPLQPGERLRNPELASTLRRIAAEGRKGFYEGPVAEQLVAALNAGGHPAERAHLEAYRPQWKRPLCMDYRGHTVLSAPPPQTGMQVLHTLALLEAHDLPALGLPTRSARAFDVLTSALRAGMTVGRLNDDPAWGAVPAAGVVSRDYARARAELVGTGEAAAAIPSLDPRPYDAASPAPACGRYEPYGPAGATRVSLAPVAADAAADPSEHGETTHLSVVDRDGNAVSLTQTNSTTFGAGAWVAGFFLNDSGFLFTDRNIDAPSESPWRVRVTTISPTVVLDRGEVRLVVGAPGAGRIPTSIVQAMVYALDYGMDPLDAVRMPRLFPTAERPVVQIEHGFSPSVLGEARAMGYEPALPAPGYARLYMIVRRGDHWVGVADPRHDGEVRGY
jgi:gamma-glutamyltranspeptidase/glutathione hydrolase